MLTLAASDLSTLGAEANDDVKSQLDMTKLSWDIDKAGTSLQTFVDSDVASAIVTDETTLTITFVSAKHEALANISDLGGQGSSDLDGLDISAGFMSDNAGNLSEQVALRNAEVSMTDQTAPTITDFSVETSSAGILGATDTITYTATASEAMRVGTSMSITLSNNVSVTLEVNPADPEKFVGTYTISDGDAESLDLTISQYSALTSVDISGNGLDTTADVTGISGAGTQNIQVDAQAPTATGLVPDGAQSLRIIFNEEIFNQIEISDVLSALDIVSNTSIWIQENGWADSGETVIVDTSQQLVAGTLDIDLSIEDEAGNVRLYDVLELNILDIV